MIKYPLYVTLDTNIFVSNKFDFDEDSTLGLLIKYTDANKIKVVLSDIVIKEVEKHILLEGDKVCASLRKLRGKVLQTTSENYLRQVGLDDLLSIPDKKAYREKSKKTWESFLERLNPEIVDCSKIDLDAIITDYFNFNPPFENNDKKRKEFPDAFIASQIRERFDKNQIVAIVSNDNGFKQACGNSENHIFYKGLGELYDTMNRQEEKYREIVKNINSYIMNYISNIKLMIMDNDCVEVYGQSCDRKGVIEGFDYSETRVISIENTVCKVHAIDEITEELVRATILCTANIDVECSYEDYDNAVWDNETESYYYLETKVNLEKHSARFAIRIVFNRKTNALEIIPFKVILNGDTLCERVDLDEEDWMMDIINQDREELGFCALDRYSDYLEENLSTSDFMSSVMNIFERINNCYSEFEELTVIYDDFITSIEGGEYKDIIKSLTFELNGLPLFPTPVNIDKISEGEMEKIISWAEESFARLSEFDTNKRLPDYFNYGETIEINIGKKIYKFVIGKISSKLDIGDKELIDLSILDDAGTLIAHGYVQLIVGYLNFDEDGGASDGIEDDIEYYCDDILNTLNTLADSIGEDIRKEWKIAGKIKTVLKADNRV